MTLVLTVLVVLAILLLNEYWWRHQHAHSEFNRKFVHIIVGSFVATWPFYLSWGQIRFLSLAFLIVVAISKYGGVFKAIHSVQRPTWGEVYFALAVGLTTIVTQNKWIYAAALLQMALADGLAAIIGVQYGKKQRYKIFGQHKSIPGTGTFFIVSVNVLLLFMYASGTPLSLWLIGGVAACATLLENVGTHGTDNLLVPIIVAFLLERLT